MREIDDPAFDRHLVSDAFMADPYPALRLLREQDPVHWSEALGAWVVTRYDDVLRTYLEVETYSNEGRLAGTLAHLPPDDRARLGVFEDFYRAKGLVHADPPDHTRLRRLILKWGFTPAQVEALRPSVVALVGRLLDDAASAGGMDVIDDLAFVLPMTVLCDLLGVPQSDGPFFRSLADRLLGFQGRNRPDLASLLAAQDAIVELQAYLDVQAARIAQGTAPADGLLGRMLAAHETDDALSRARAAQHRRDAAHRRPRDDDVARRQRALHAAPPPRPVAGGAGRPCADPPGDRGDAPLREPAHAPASPAPRRRGARRPGASGAARRSSR